MYKPMEKLVRPRLPGHTELRHGSYSSVLSTWASDLCPAAFTLLCTECGRSAWMSCLRWWIQSVLSVFAALFSWYKWGHLDSKHEIVHQHHKARNQKYLGIKQVKYVMDRYWGKNAVVFVWVEFLCFKIGSHEGQAGFELLVLWPSLPKWRQPHAHLC